MKGIVFDIETVGEDFESLDETSKEYFLKFADTPEKEKEARGCLGFYPLTAEIVAIGMIETDSDAGAVYFQNGNGVAEKFRDEAITYVSGTEKEILQHFWNQVKRYETVVTFNGRVFDCPFVMLRSAIHQIRATQNLMPYRYSYNFHVDLIDHLTFYDALRRRFSLHMWCRAFGIPSPKESGVSGLMVKELYRHGQYKEIAQYCLGDVKATKALYKSWEKYLKC